MLRSNMGLDKAEVWKEYLLDMSVILYSSSSSSYAHSSVRTAAARPGFYTSHAPNARPPMQCLVCVHHSPSPLHTPSTFHPLIIKISASYVSPALGGRPQSALPATSLISSNLLPSLTTLYRIILGSRPSVFRTVCWVLDEESKRRMK
jgi:hypothetical protein